jgi:FtsP/CotA-like multicopper oxidase with cupredoxin domain
MATVSSSGVNSMSAAPRWARTAPWLGPKSRAGEPLAPDPGERYSVLVHLDKPGTWVWHCHILNHVERDTGMYGMVTAVVVS